MTPPDDERLRRKSARQEARREAIVDAAARVLAERGPSGLSASAVARAADVSAPSLYYYFDSLPHIATALAERLMRRVSERLGGAIEEAPSGLEATATLVRLAVHYYVQRPDEWRLLFQGVAALELDADGLRERILPLTGALFARLASRLEDDRVAGRLHPDVDPRRLANLAWCQAQGILSMVMAAEASGTDTRFGVDGLVEGAVALLRRGAASPGELGSIG